MSEAPRRPVLELMRRVAPLAEDATIADAAERIATAGTGLPVVDSGGRLVGYLNEQDVLAAITPGYLRDLHDTEFFTRDLSALGRRVAAAGPTPVRDHMDREICFVDIDDSITHAAELFLHHRTRALAVIDGAEVVGVLRLGDVIGDLMRSAQTGTGG